MTDYKAILGEIESAKLAIGGAQSGGSNNKLQAARETLKNLLFNYVDGVIDALKFAAEGDAANANIKEELEATAAALDDADRENAELRKKLKEFEQPKDKKKGASV